MSAVARSRKNIEAQVSSEQWREQWTITERRNAYVSRVKTFKKYMEVVYECLDAGRLRGDGVAEKLNQGFPLPKVVPLTPRARDRVWRRGGYSTRPVERRTGTLTGSRTGTLTVPPRIDEPI